MSITIAAVRCREMKRSIKYPEFVKKSKIKEVGDDTYRYSLYIPFDNTGSDRNTLAVILKNPSKASKSEADITVSKVCNVAYYNGYSAVIILNLFPIRSTDPKGVLKLYSNPSFNLIMNRNFSNIKKTCKGIDVVLAWGKDSISRHSSNAAICRNIYRNVVRFSTKLASKYATDTFFVKRCRCQLQLGRCTVSCTSPPCERYPLHGQCWCNNEQLIKYN